MDSPTLVCGTQYDTMNKKSKKINTDMGRGALTKAPVAQARLRKAVAPVITSRPNGIRVSHHEFCTTISAPLNTAFQVLPPSNLTPGLDLNPGCFELFPWLAGLSRMYEKYRFTSLRFTFVPSQPSTVAGKYYAAIDYDYDDEVPTTKINMLTNHSTVQNSVWAECSLTVDCALMKQNMDWRYTLTSPTRVGGIEPRTVYGGFLVVATDGLSDDCSFDVWADYVVELSIERLDDVSLFATQTQAVGPAAVVVSGANRRLMPTAPTALTAFPTYLASGTPNYPAVAASNSYPWVLDMSSAIDSMIQLRARLRPGVANPATDILTDTTTTPVVAVLDRLGSTILTQLSMTNFTASSSWSSREASSDPTVNGSIAELGTSIDWTAILRALPTARYLAMSVETTPALAAVIDVMHVLYSGSYR